MRLIGVGWTLQELPSQRSASVSEVPALLSATPTAVQADAVVQETANRPLSVVRLATGSNRQRCPFHCLAMALTSPAASTS